MRRSHGLTLTVWVSLALGATACTEKPQIAGSKVVGTPAFQGAADPYVVPGWKVGDATSWDKQLATRAQNQNEYERIGSR